jgi:hypothetical protein
MARRSDRRHASADAELPKGSEAEFATPQTFSGEEPKKNDLRRRVDDPRGALVPDDSVP